MDGSLTFVQKLNPLWHEQKFLCIGIDPVLEKLPTILQRQPAPQAFVTFAKAIIDATHDLVLCYKPNIAFYEALGDEGIHALQVTMQYLHQRYPLIPVIIDAKRGDIDSTNNGYVTEIFDVLHADAVTVNPYLGSEALLPFLQRQDKGILILAKTSNKGSGEFQDQLVTDKKIPLWQYVATQVATTWNTNKNCGVVVGATYTNELKIARAAIGDIPILVPGIGAQGGDIAETVRSAKNSEGNGMIISASRSIIYASSEADFAEKARTAAESLSKLIQEQL